MRFSRFLAAALVLACATSASAQTPPPPPDWYHFTWEIPILRGEYMPINGGTLGALSVGYTEDSRRGFGGAAMFFNAAGNPVTQAADGQVHINEDAVIAATGVLAWTEVVTFDMFDGPCRGCANHPRQQTRTTDVSKFEWTGPRAGRLTVNGQTQDMVEAFSGPPLVGSTDMAGTWILASRWDRLYYGSTPPGNSVHSENLVLVKLVPVNPARTYTTVVDLYPGLTAPIGSVPLPPPGARQYDIVCANDSACSIEPTLGLRGAQDVQTIWFDERGVGRVLPVRRSGSGATATYVVADTGHPQPRVYATKDLIVGRVAEIPNMPHYVRQEYGFYRIGAEVLRAGEWRAPPCSLVHETGCNGGG